MSHFIEVEWRDPSVKGAPMDTPRWKRGILNADDFTGVFPIETNDMVWAVLRNGGTRWLNMTFEEARSAFRADKGE